MSGNIEHLARGGDQASKILIGKYQATIYLEGELHRWPPA